MPNMTKTRSFHSLVCVKNKLFVIDYTCEQFDKFCNRFVTLKSLSLLSFSGESIITGNKIFVLQNNRGLVLCYDVDKDECSKKFCEALQDLRHSYLLLQYLFVENETLCTFL